MLRFILPLRLIVPALWMGLIIGLSFIETPLKFLAPGITIPLGLGIGRLVFTALSIAGWVLWLLLVLLAIARPRESRRGLLLIVTMGVIALVQSVVIRPLLAARSDVIIAGGDPGESWLHYGYIAAELVLLIALLGYLLHASKPITTPGSGNGRNLG